MPSSLGKLVRFGAAITRRAPVAADMPLDPLLRHYRRRGFGSDFTDELQSLAQDGQISSRSLSDVLRRHGHDPMEADVYGKLYQEDPGSFGRNGPLSTAMKHAADYPHLWNLSDKHRDWLRDRVHSPKDDSLSGWAVPAALGAGGAAGIGYLAYRNARHRNEPGRPGKPGIVPSDIFSSDHYLRDR